MPKPVQATVCDTCGIAWTAHLLQARRHALLRLNPDDDGPIIQSIIDTPIKDFAVSMEECVALLKEERHGPPGPQGPMGAAGRDSFADRIGTP